MITLRTVARVRATVAAWKREGQRVAFVPTMGNLHAGHYSLIALARHHAERVIASVFVNPAQFGPDEDFASYPRTPDADALGLSDHGCDALFVPGVEEVYPFGIEYCVRVQVPGISDVLDGAHRPGHFDGVATVVTRLFNIVQAQVAVFGRKDYQQLRVIEYLVRDLALPIEIVAAATVREDDGLAMSSRNQRLSADERHAAPELRRSLQFMREALHRSASIAAVEAEAGRRLAAVGFAVDYAQIRRGADLARPQASGESGLVALVAARLGRTRLIDNLEIDGE